MMASSEFDAHRVAAACRDVLATANVSKVTDRIDLQRLLELSETAAGANGTQRVVVTDTEFNLIAAAFRQTDYA